MHSSNTIFLLSVLVATSGAESDRRPAPERRTFRSEAVDAEVERVSALVGDATLRMIFRNSFPSTLDTTIAHNAQGGADTFVITGDIEAMWLRDSAQQLLPYCRFAAADAPLRALLQGAVRRHAASLLLDRYANAFNFNASGAGWQTDTRKPAMGPAVFEGKYELDSLANVVHFAHALWAATNDTAPFESSTWKNAMDIVVATIVAQQASTLEMADDPPYFFQRETKAATDTQMLSGLGAPGARCGLSRSVFRPSDDAATLPYLVPSNMFAVVALRELGELWAKALGNTQKAKIALALADEIDTALKKHAQIQTSEGVVWAYEVDCFGSAYFMDDSNQPGLLGIPLFGFCSIDDPIYQRTRKAVLSPLRNPYFFSGKAGSGIGGPHAGIDCIWPMSLIVQALTSQDDAEIAQCLATLKATALYGSKTTPGQGYGFMHECFNANDPSRFTRPWFAWANSLFGTLIIKLAAERPHLLQ